MWLPPGRSPWCTVSVPPIDPALIAYLQEHRHLPRLGDERPPWTYRGWALPYIEALHGHPGTGFPDRWGYLLEAHATKRLPNRPIPEVAWNGHAGEAPEVQRQIKKAMDQLAPYVGVWQAFLAFVDWIGFALGIDTERPEISTRVSPNLDEWLYRHLNFAPWLEHPYDHLGEYLAQERGSGFNPHAFFPTPMSLCTMMTAMLYVGSGDMRATTVCDPCLGTGRMLLAASNHSMRLYGQDIDGMVLKIAKINGALYAPWLCWPLPEEVWANFEPLPCDAHGNPVDPLVAVVAHARELVDQVARAEAEVVHPDVPTTAPSASPEGGGVDGPAPAAEASPVAVVGAVEEPPPPALEVPALPLPVAGPSAAVMVAELVPEYRVDHKGQGLLFAMPEPEPARGRKSSARAKR